jgi:hypothetical protein
MFKAKMLFGLALVLGALAAAAVPAAAQWETKGGGTGATKGQGKAGSGAFEGGGGTVTCESAEGTWTAPAAKGATEIKLNITKWNNCKAKSNTITEAATVNACETELKQPSKEGEAAGKATGTQISKTCTIKTGLGCEITYNASENKELGPISLSKSGSNQIDKFGVTGITDKANGICELGGITSTKAGLLKTEATLEGIGLI